MNGHGGARVNAGGARPGAGRPKQEARERFERVFAATFTEAKIEAVLKVLIKEAEDKRNIKAIQLLLAYLAGTPTPHQEEVKSDGGPPTINIIFEEAKAKPAQDGDKERAQAAAEE